MSDDAHPAAEPDYTPKAFGRRLTYVCALDGLSPRRLAELCEVTERTARRWLRGETMWRWGGRAFRLAERLNVSRMWLFFGDGHEPEEYRLIQQYKAMNRWEQRQFQRLALRVLNNCPKADRLLKMAAAGQISRTQLFQAM